MTIMAEQEERDQQEIDQLNAPLRSFTGKQTIPENVAAGAGVDPDQAEIDALNKVGPVAEEEELQKSKPKPSSFLRRGVVDPLVSLAKGTLVGIPEAAVGLADIPTLGYTGKGVEKLLKSTIGGGFKEAGEAFDVLLSPEARAAQQKVAEAKGFIPTLQTALENPSSIVSTIFESIPSMFGGAMVGRAALKGLGLAVKAGATPAIQAGRAIAGGAIGEAAVSIGQNTEQVRQLAESGLITPSQAAVLVASGVTTGIISRMSGGLARRLKITDVDALLQGINTGDRVGVIGLLKGLIGSAITEGAFEELPQSAQEQMAQNIALGKPPTEGVAEAAAMGLLAGAGMGMMGAGGARLMDRLKIPNPVTEQLKTDPVASKIEEDLAALDTEGVLKIPIPAVDKAIAEETGIELPPPSLEPSPEDLVAQKPSDEAMEALEVNYVEQAEALGARYLGMNPGDPESGISPFPEFDTPDVGNFTLQGDETVEQALARKTEQFKLPEEKIVPPSAAEKVTVFPGVPFNRLEEYVQEAKDRGYPDAEFVAEPDGKEGRIVASAPEGGEAPAGRRERSDKAIFMRQFVKENTGRLRGEGKQVDRVALVNEAVKTWDETHPPTPEAAEVAVAASEAATSPENTKPEPTEAQKEAGNYEMGHVNVQGLDISIENPAGSVRTGTDESGKPWETPIVHHYGYIKGTKSNKDGKLDVFVGPNPESQNAFVIVQVDPETKKFDEHKTMVGFDTIEEAEAGYLANYDETGSSRIKNIIPMSMDQFKQWIKGNVVSELKAAPKLEGKGAAAVREKIKRVKESKFSKEIQVAVDKVQNLTKQLGVKIGKITYEDRTRALDYKDPEDRRIIEAWGLPEEKLNAIRTGKDVAYVDGKHEVYEVSSKTGELSYRSDITLYRGHSPGTVYHEVGHAIHRQKYLQGKFPLDVKGNNERAARYVERMLREGKERDLISELKAAPAKAPPAAKKVKGSESLPMFNLKTKSGKTITNPAMVLTKLKNDNPLETKKQIEKIAKAAGQWREVTEEGWKNIMDTLRRAPTVGELAATGYAGRASRWWYKDDETFFKKVLGKDTYKFFGVMAATSPQAKAETENLRFGVNAWTDYTNLRKKLGREPNREEITELVSKMDVGIGVRRGGLIRALSGEQLGKSADTLKTRFYHNALFGIELGAVLDIWHGRGMGMLKFVKEKTKIDLAQDFGDSIIYSVLADRMDKAAATLDVLQSASQASQWSLIKALWDRMGPSKNKRKYGGIEALKSLTNKNIADAGNYTTGIANYFKEDHPIIGKLEALGIPREEMAKLKTAAEQLEGRGIDPNASIYRDAPPAIQKELERLAVRLEKTRDIIDTLKAQEAHAKRGDPSLYMSLETTHGPFAGLPWTKRLAMHNELRSGPLSDAVIKTIGMTFGLKVTGVVDGPGDWYNPKTKKTEINPNFTVLMAVPPGKTKKELAKAIQGFGATLAYANRQASVGFTHPVAMDPLFEPLGGPVVIVDIGRTISKEQAAALSKAMAETFPEDTAFKVPTSNGFIITMPKYDEGYPLSYADFADNVIKSLDKAGINNVKGIKYAEKDILEGGDLYEGRRDGEDVAGEVSPYTAAIDDSRGPRGVVRADKLLTRIDAIKEKYITRKIERELKRLAIGQAGLGEEGVQEGVDLSLRTRLNAKETARVAEAIAKDPAVGALANFKNKTVILTHWSKEPNLTVTDPKKHGTGWAGAESKGKSAYPELWVPRTYYGYEKYVAEVGLGKHRYKAKVPGNNIYDAWEDPLKLYPSAEETRAMGYYTGTAQGMIHEQRILAAGFRGYAYDQSQAAAIFTPEAVTKVEDSEKSLPQEEAKGIDYSLSTMISAITNRPMSKTPTPPSTNQRASFDSPEVTPLNKFLYKMVDRQVGIGDIQKAIKNFSQTISSSVDAALREVLFSGRVGARVGDFLKDELRPVYQMLSATGFKTRNDLDDFQEYLYIRHAKEANAHVRTLKDEDGNLTGLQDGGSGITDEQADKAMAKIPPALLRRYESIARMVDKVTKKNAQLMADYGLETQETVDKLREKFPHYAPLFREDIEEGTIGSGTGASITGATHKARKGSLLPVQVPNILAHIANQRERIISRGEKNTLASALYGLAKANPNSDYWKLARPGIKTETDIETGTKFKRVDLSYRQRDNVVMHRTIENGKVVEKGVEFNVRNEHAKRTADAIKNLDMDTLGAILGTSAKVTRFISAMNTQYNPIFGITNFVRDVGFAMLTLSTTPIAGKQSAVLRRALPNILGIYKVARGDMSGKIAQDFNRLRLAGGLTGYRDLFKTTEKRTNALVREFETLTKGGFLKGGYAIKNWLSDYNLAMESAIRLASFQVGIESGMSEDKAAAMAKSLTVNFNRKGQIATQAGAMYAFFNASVQGIDKMVETLRGPMGRRIISGGLAFGILQAAVLAAAGFGEDEPPEWVQERNIIIPLGGGRYHTIPMPLGFNVIPNIGRVSAQIAMTGFKDPGKRIAGLFGMIVEAFSPLGSSGLSLQTIMPTPLDPFVALAENKDWTGKPIYREDFSKLDPTPGEARARENADFISKLLAQGLNRLSGGTAHTPGLLSPTPEQLAYLVGQAGGGVTREAEKAVKTLETLVTGEELPPYKIPIVSRFYGTTEGKAQQSSKFYENIKSMNIHENEIQGRKKTGKGYGDYFKKHPEAVMYKVANRAETSVSKLNKKRREMIDRGAPKEMIKTMENLISARMGAFNSQVAQARE